MTTIQGVDVSSVQGVVDWGALHVSGIKFAFVKCVEGNTLRVDSKFWENVAGATAAGIAVSPYFFAYPLPGDSTAFREPAAQAAHWFELSMGYGSKRGQLAPALDAEWPVVTDWSRWGCSALQIRAWVLECLRAMRGLWGRTPYLYTYPDWWGHIHGALEPEFATASKLWMANYDKRPPLGPWTKATFVQISGGGMKLPGSGVPCDEDVFNGDDLTAETEVDVTDGGEDEPLYITPE